MSTIPSTARTVPYTVMGGERKPRLRQYNYDLSIVLVNRTGRLYREDALAELAGAEGELISIQGPEPVPEIGELVRKYPGVRFILLHEACTMGERVNLGIGEAQARYVLVAGSDLRIPAPALSSRLLSRISERNALCVLPVLKNTRMETVPSLEVPGFSSARLKLVPWAPHHDGMKSVFPFDYAGIYDKEKFRFTGGYDGQLTSPYWQKADFGFRGNLWGEEFPVHTALYFQYRGEIPSEDATPDESYKRFYLKNMAVDFRRDRGVLGTRRFPGYWAKSNTGFLRAWREFRAARSWVRLNRYRYKTDARRLVELWQPPE